MLKVGSELELACGRCKEMRYHTVAALGADGSVASVVCNFCHTSHRYHGKAATVTRVARSNRVRSHSSALDGDLDPSKPARPYSPSAKYEKGDHLDHAKFGRGSVIDVRGDRIDVRFADGGLRVFVHMRPTGLGSVEG